MKKHFLLLVMALMSMTAWAQTNIKDFPTRFNAVQFGTPVVAATDLNVYDEGISSSTPLSYPSDLTWDGKVYSDADCTTEVTFPYAVGSYFVKVVGSGTKYNGEIKKPINIVQKTIYVALNWNNGTADVTAPLTKTFGDADPEWTLNWDKTVFVAPDTKAKVSTIFSGTAKLKAHSENVAYTTEATPKVTGVDIELEGLTSTNYIVKLDPAYEEESSSSTTTLDFTKMLINPKPLSTTDNPAAGLVYTATYQAKQVEPKFTIKDGKTVLSEKAVSGTTVTGDYEVTYSSEDAGINASTTPYTVSIKGIKNYTGTLTGKVTINKAPLSVLVKDVKVPYIGKEYTVNEAKIKSITTPGETPTYGTKTYDFEFVYSGYVGGDLAKSMDASTASSYVPTTKPTVAITLATGEKALNVKEGNYPLKVTIPTECTLTNYEISALNGTAVSGKLVIEPYELIVTATTTTQAYGENEKVIPYTLNSDGYTLQTLTPAAAGKPAVMEKEFTTEPVFQKGGEGITPGEYPITLKSEGVTSSNFVVKKYVVSEYNEDGKTFKSGTPTYKINKAAVTVFVLPHEKTYGEADPASLTNPVVGVDYVVTGVEDTSVLTGVVLKKDSESEDAGVYALTADFSALGEAFAVTNTPGTFTIKQKEIKVTALPQTLCIGNDNTFINPNAYTIDAELGLATKDAENAAKVFKLDFRTEDEYAAATGITAFADGVEYYTKSGETYTKVAVGTAFDSSVTYYVKTASKVDLSSAGALTTAKTYPVGIVVKLIETGEGALGKNYVLKDCVAGQLNVVDAAGTIVLDDAADDIETVISTAAAATAKKYNVAFTTRQLKKGQWTTLWLPFETTVAKVSAALGYAIVDMLVEDPTVEAMNFKIHMGEIPAYTPFLVKVAEDVDLMNVTFTSEKIVAPVEANMTKENKSYEFKSNLKKQVIGQSFWTAGDKMANDGFEFNKYKATATLKALRAYIIAKEGVSAAPVIYIEEADGTTTAINGVESEIGSNAEGWYTIGGMKLQGAPSQKGIYIQNGKKVIVK